MVRSGRAAMSALFAGLVLQLWPAAAPSVLAAGAADKLEPHRAIYGLSLARSEPRGAAVTNARGKLEFEWSDVCDGWSIRQRTRIIVTHGDGGEIDFGWTLTAWESKDGLAFRFFIRRLFSGGEEETIRGVARLDGPGLGGTATYSEPEAKTVTLPKGTVFPSQHNFQVIDAAEAGELPLWRTVFDGSGDSNGLYGVNVALAAAVPPGAELSLDVPLVQDVPSWRLVVAYFDPEDETAPPSFEQQLRLFANGVVDELVLDYGEFTLDAELADLQPLPPPDC
ncbi:MAG: EipB family protein [Kiloniellales bacterium]